MLPKGIVGKRGRRVDLYDGGASVHKAHFIYEVVLITLKEYIGNTDIHFVPIEHQRNIDILLPRLNQFRSVYGKPMIVTSGYRSNEDQIRIYAAKGITDPAKIPMNSWHLKGGACDFADVDGALGNFCVQNLSLLKQNGLWLEDPRWTHGRLGNWVHLQCFPPASKKRVFIPDASQPDVDFIWDGKYNKLYD